MTASRVIGVRERAMVGGRHLIPNIFGPLTVVATFGVASAILLDIAALSFLGLGVQPPDPEPGRSMVSAAAHPRMLPDPALDGWSAGVVIALIGACRVQPRGRRAARRSSTPGRQPWRVARPRPRRARPPAAHAPAGRARPASSTFRTGSGVVTRRARHRPTTSSAGEIVGLVGESGSRQERHEPAPSRACCRQPAGRIEGGRIVFDGRSLLDLAPDGDARQVRGPSASR
ncbi:MAG: hypothetical protein V9G19_14865 [Tetrasphaera sp.]